MKNLINIVLFFVNDIEVNRLEEEFKQNMTKAMDERKGQNNEKEKNFLDYKEMRNNAEKEFKRYSIKRKITK